MPVSHRLRPAWTFAPAGLPVFPGRHQKKRRFHLDGGRSRHDVAYHTKTEMDGNLFRPASTPAADSSTAAPAASAVSLVGTFQQPCTRLAPDLHETCTRLVPFQDGCKPTRARWPRPIHHTQALAARCLCVVCNSAQLRHFAKDIYVARKLSAAQPQPLRRSSRQSCRRYPPPFVSPLPCASARPPPAVTASTALALPAPLRRAQRLTRPSTGPLRFFGDPTPKKNPRKTRFFTHCA